MSYGADCCNLECMYQGCELVGDLRERTTIAVGNRIRDLARLKRFYGEGHWRKLKGKADVRLPDGTVVEAEVHWYEMASVGRKEIKIKRILN